MLKLAARQREETGKKNKDLRKTGFIPAVLYGPGLKKNLHLSVKAQDFDKIYKQAGESTLIELAIETKKEAERKIVLVYETAKDPVSDEIIHIDFYQVKMNQPIKVEVPLIFVGESEAVEKDNGILLKNYQSVEIEALPKDLIHEIEVDISSLKTFEDHFCVKDLKVPETVKVLADKDDIVASVTPPRSAEELEELEQAPAEAAEPEVEEKGKEEELKKPAEEAPAGQKEEKEENKEENA